MDSCYRIWSSKKPANKPLLVVSCVEKGWLLDGKWDPLGRGLYLSHSDSSNITWEALWTEGNYKAGNISRFIFTSRIFSNF